MPTPHRQPRYRAIADELRRRITAGAIPAGALIPSESALTAEFRVARGTIREAINVLRAEGFVVTEHGRGTYARPDLPVRRVSSDRYRLVYEENDEPSRRGRRTSEPAEQVDAEFREVPATAELADLFEVEPATILLQRRLFMSAHGIPQAMVTSYYLLDMVAGTPVADPNREPWLGGHVAQLACIGITATQIRETVSMRISTAEEAVVLKLPVGAQLIVVRRRTWADSRIVEVAADILYPAGRTEVEYEVVLGRPSALRD